MHSFFSGQKIFHTVWKNDLDFIMMTMRATLKGGKRQYEKIRETAVVEKAPSKVSPRSRLYLISHIFGALEITKIVGKIEYLTFVNSTSSKSQGSFRFRFSREGVPGLGKKIG